MTHPDYLERFHEITTRVLPEIDIRLGRGDVDDGKTLLAQLRAKLSDLWTQRQVTAGQEVAP